MSSSSMISSSPSSQVKIAASIIVLLLGAWFITSGHHRTALGYTNVDTHNAAGGTTTSSSSIGATPRGVCSGCPCPAPITVNCTCNLEITSSELLAAAAAHKNMSNHKGKHIEASNGSGASCEVCTKCDVCPPPPPPVVPCDTCATKATLCADSQPPLTVDAIAAPDPAHGGRNGTLIIYSYFEDPDPMKPAKQNFEFFVEVAMRDYINHPHVHFFIIVNGEHFTVNLPAANNIFVHRRARNFGMDICAYAESFPLVDSGEIKLPQKLERYRHFIMMNASVRGPFMPNGVQITWLNYFLSQLNDKVKLVGTSINCLSNNHPDAKLPGRRYGQMHLQSMFLAYDYHILPLVRAHLPCGDGWQIPVYGGEIQFTVETLAHGYGLGPQLLSFRGVDFTDVNAANAACDRAHGGDHYFPGNYNGINISPLEVIFYKANRDVDTTILNKYTDWVLQEIRSRPKKA